MTQDIVLRRRRGASPWLAMSLVSITLFVLGWSALWLFGRHEAGKIVDAWIASEAAHGRVWSCPDRTITGFPFEISVSCLEPTFRGKAGGAVVRASVSGFKARSFVYQPSAVEASATGPLTVHREGDNADTTLAWSALNITFRGLTADRKRGSLVLDGPELNTSDGSTARADRFEARIGPAVGRSADENAYDVWLTLDKGLIPALDDLTGTPDAVAIEQKGVLTHVAVTRMTTWQDLAEDWRVAGGTLSLSTLNIAKGALQIGAQGDIGLDDAHRPAGHLDVAASGYETLAARLGIPVRAVSIGGALAQLLNHKGAAPASSSQDGARVSLPVILADGRVLIGPVKTGLRLQPLY